MADPDLLKVALMDKLSPVLHIIKSFCYELTLIEPKKEQCTTSLVTHRKMCKICPDNRYIAYISSTDSCVFVYDDNIKIHRESICPDLLCWQRDRTISNISVMLLCITENDNKNVFVMHRGKVLKATKKIEYKTEKKYDKYKNIISSTNGGYTFENGYISFTFRSMYHDQFTSTSYLYPKSFQRIEEHKCEYPADCPYHLKKIKWIKTYKKGTEYSYILLTFGIGIFFLKAKLCDTEWYLKDFIPIFCNKEYYETKNDCTLHEKFGDKCISQNDYAKWSPNNTYLTYFVKDKIYIRHKSFMNRIIMLSGLGFAWKKNSTLLAIIVDNGRRIDIRKPSTFDFYFSIPVKNEIKAIKWLESNIIAWNPYNDYLVSFDTSIFVDEEKL
uniref:Uncharacterized protein n=1 Tax=viral metagenome TaxID=1070528 RepID=A0A6C0EB87_9ZZZZ